MEQQEIDQIIKILDEYEKPLSWKKSGSIEDRISHVLSQYRSIADSAIFQAKAFAEDVKTQFKALEIIMEGLTTNGLNHTEKRTIANHIITTLRSMVDRLDQKEFDFNTNLFDRYNYFRSQTPEARLFQKYRELKDNSKANDEIVKRLTEKRPDVLKELKGDDLPF